MVNKNKMRVILKTLKGEFINLTYYTSEGMNSAEACKVIEVSKNHVTLAKPIPVHSQEPGGPSEITFNVIIDRITKVEFYSGLKKTG